MKTQRHVSLLAVEVDGHSVSEVERACDEVLHRIVVAQRPTESAGKFAARLIQRIRKLQKHGASVVKAALACNSRSDVAAISARVLVLRSMLAANPDLSDSDLALTSSDRVGSLRYQFEAIMMTLREHAFRGKAGRVRALLGHVT